CCLRYAPRDDPITQAFRARLIGSVALPPVGAARDLAYAPSGSAPVPNPGIAPVAPRSRRLSATRCLGPLLIGLRRLTRSQLSCMISSNWPPRTGVACRPGRFGERDRSA